MSRPKLLDLFSGIGGFSLGLERAGFETVAFCEIDPFCRRVLAKHWPEVPCYEDVRDLDADTLSDDGISVDAICGGFPCQDVSRAGYGAGIDGSRSGLWDEFARLIGELQPRVCIVENVTGLLDGGGWEPFSGTWPRWGMMRTGDAFELPTWGRRTPETGFGLLPTPQASDNRNRGTLGRTPAVTRRAESGKQLMLSMLFDGAPCPHCVESMMGFPAGWTNPD